MINELKITRINLLDDECELALKIMEFWQKLMGLKFIINPWINVSGASDKEIERYLEREI